jgi:hypothetical protein
VCVCVCKYIYICIQDIYSTEIFPDLLAAVMAFLNLFSNIYLVLYKPVLLLALQLCQNKLVKNLQIQCTAVFNGWVWLKVFHTNLFMDLKLLESFGNNGFFHRKWTNENQSNLKKWTFENSWRNYFFHPLFLGSVWLLTPSIRIGFWVPVRTIMFAFFCVFLWWWISVI